MSTDTLSDVLRAVRLTGAVFFTIDAVPPWVAEAPPARAAGGRRRGGRGGARPVLAPGGGGVGRASLGQRVRAGAAERADVRGGRAPSPRQLARRADGLAGRVA